MKRGQITLFIVVGIVLIVVFAALLAFSGSFGGGALDVEVDDSRALQTFIESCMTEVGETGLFLLGRQGGFAYEVPQVHHVETYGLIGYSFYDGAKTLVTPEVMKAQFDVYVEKNLPACLNSFSEFEAQGIEIDPANIQSDVTFAARDTLLKVSYPIRVKSGGTTLSLDDFSVRFQVRVRHLHQIVSGIADRKIDNPEYLDMTYLGEQDVNATIVTNENAVQVIVLEDPESELKTGAYKFLTVVN